MSEKKYEFTGETKVNDDGVTLHRIRALRDTWYCKKGDLGGWIEKEENLSHAGQSWIKDESEAYGNAQVYGNALVSSNSRILNNAQIYGNALLGYNSVARGSAQIYGFAILTHEVIIESYQQVFGCQREIGPILLTNDL